MNIQGTINAAESAALVKADPTSPVFTVKDRETIAIKAGTQFNGVTFAEEAILESKAALAVGGDYVVLATADGATIERADGIPDGNDVLGGFHFAPGGNAAARAGGDDIPAINPCSLWDRNFRPACPDPRGMTLVDGISGKFWCDIYLCGADHLKQGSSRFGAVIADGKTETFDYPAAVAALAHHGKGLLDLYEFPAAAFGVTEKTSHDGDPVRAGLDAPRTSRYGVMQATGNMWVWGNDGDPDTPRASLFGGAWWYHVGAGSRRAHVGYWPGLSDESIGARGRSDHLQLG